MSNTQNITVVYKSILLDLFNIGKCFSWANNIHVYDLMVLVKLYISREHFFSSHMKEADVINNQTLYQ